MGESKPVKNKSYIFTRIKVGTQIFALAQNLTSGARIEPSPTNKKGNPNFGLPASTVGAWRWWAIGDSNPGPCD